VGALCRRLSQSIIIQRFFGSKICDLSPSDSLLKPHLGGAFLPVLGKLFVIPNIHIASEKSAQHLLFRSGAASGTKSTDGLS
jgi:hypothetical protein